MDLSKITDPEIMSDAIKQKFGVDLNLVQISGGFSRDGNPVWRFSTTTTGDNLTKAIRSMSEQGIFASIDIIDTEVTDPSIPKLMFTLGGKIVFDKEKFPSLEMTNRLISP